MNPRAAWDSANQICAAREIAMLTSTNGKRSSRTIAIAAGVLSIALGAARASAASQLAGSAAGSAALIASGAPAAVQAAVDGKGYGKSNAPGKGNKHRLELPIDWFHHVLGSVGSALKSVTNAEN